MGLTFRSQSLQDGETPEAARWWFDLIEGLPGHEPPQVRGEDVIAPGRQGHYTGNRVNDNLPLLIEGWIRGTGATPGERTDEWHQNTLTILSVFQLDTSPGTLIALPGSNGYLGLTDNAEIQARTLDLMAGPIRSRMSHQTWSIRLESVDGVWWDLGSS